MGEGRKVRQDEASTIVYWALGLADDYVVKRLMLSLCLGVLIFLK